MTITVTDVDEDPVMAAPTGTAGHTSKDHPENTAIATAVSTYSATDEDDAVADLTWSLSGADREHFAIGNGGNAPDFTRGELTFEAIPDFEARADSGRNNVYNVTVVVTDSGGNTDTRDVAVTVENVEEDGTVTLSTLYPEVDARLEATLTDPDDRITNVTWQWARVDSTVQHRPGHVENLHAGPGRRWTAPCGRQPDTPTERAPARLRGRGDRKTQSWWRPRVTLPLHSVRATLKAFSHCQERGRGEHGRGRGRWRRRYGRGLAGRHA